eukprot:1155800-Pelagomonas_calceolata.AAC.4
MHMLYGHMHNWPSLEGGHTASVMLAKGCFGRCNRGVPSNILCMHTDAPGMTPEDIKVEITAGNLVVSGEKTQQHFQAKVGSLIQVLNILYHPWTKCTHTLPAILGFVFSFLHPCRLPETVWRPVCGRTALSAHSTVSQGDVRLKDPQEFL